MKSLFPPHLVVEYLTKYFLNSKMEHYDNVYGERISSHQRSDVEKIFSWKEEEPPDFLLVCCHQFSNSVFIKWNGDNQQLHRWLLNLFKSNTEFFLYQTNASFDWISPEKDAKDVFDFVQLINHVPQNLSNDFDKLMMTSIEMWLHGWSVSSSLEGGSKFVLSKG